MASTISNWHQIGAPSLPEPQTNTQGKQEVSKEAFMQLLVAQIKHQNPLSPSDGVQFLTQLAQFSELEQLTNINSTLTEMKTPVTTTDDATSSTESTQKSS
jgi:flagellar basal-body rod modification protein FlgD